MATIQEVAKRAGVSTATVSRVLNQSGYVSEELTKRVLIAVRELEYYPNEVARSLSTGSTRGVGLILPDISNPFFATIAKGAENSLWREGFSLMLCDTNEDRSQQQIHLDALVSKRMDGLLIVPTSGGEESLAGLLSKGISCVFVDRYPVGIEAAVDYVGSDNFAGAYDAVSHLLSKGHRSIGVLLGSRRVSTTQERLSGYRQAIQDAGGEMADSYVHFGCVDVGTSYQEASDLLTSSADVSAVFCTNTLATIGTLRAIRDVGRRCPGDVSIVGFDDLPLSDLFERPVTTVSQDAYQLGAKASELLLKRIRGAEAGPATREIVPCRLVEGHSVSARPARRRSGQDA